MVKGAGSPLRKCFEAGIYQVDFEKHPTMRAMIARIEKMERMVIESKTMADGAIAASEKSKQFADACHAKMLIAIELANLAKTEWEGKLNYVGKRSKRALDLHEDA